MTTIVCPHCGSLNTRYRCDRYEHFECYDCETIEDGELGYYLDR